MRNLYLVLGVRPNASAAELKRAYRELAKQHHPDWGGDAQRFAEIEEAFSLLSDQERRAEYDAQRAAWIDQVEAVACMQCGEANSTKKIARGKVAICGHCRAELPKAKAVRSPLVMRAAELGLDLAERGIDHTETLLSEGLDLSFGRIRDGIRSKFGRKPR